MQLFITWIKQSGNTCNVCEHSSNYSLNIHMRTHSRGKPFKCGQCDYASSQKGNLSNHITNKHTGIRSIKCNVCDFASSYKSSLKLHMKLHLTENPYKCNQCTFSTLWMDCLKRHIKRKHAFDKLIICCQAEQLLNCSMSKSINTSIHNMYYISKVHPCSHKLLGFLSLFLHRCFLSWNSSNLETTGCKLSLLLQLKARFHNFIYL